MKIFMVFLAFLNALSAMCAVPAEPAEVQIYARDGIILDDGLGGFLIEDTTENLWECDCSGFSAGQRVVLVMCDCGTPTIYDDEVLRVLPLAVPDYHDVDNLHLSGEVFG